MENQRLFIFIGIVFLGMLLYQEWQRDYGVSTETPVAVSSGSPADPASINSAVPAPAASASDVPVAAQAAKPSGPTISGEDNKLISAQKIRVRTDYLEIVLDTKGGDIRSVKLREYPVAQD